LVLTAWWSPRSTCATSRRWKPRWLISGVVQDIDLLINNAGLALGTAPAQQAKLEDWRTMIATNVTGLVELTHRLLPTLIARKGARSTSVRSPAIPTTAATCTAKLLVRSSPGAAVGSARTGVRVTSVEPGMTETEFTLVRTGGNQAASDALYKGANPMKPEEIADVLLWIATLPAHININRLELMPVNQSFGGFQVFRGQAG
jgi:serine 3-dehydrogenase